MKRDTRIVLGFAGAVPAVILAAASVCTLAIAQGASKQWRLAFRLMCHGLVQRCFELSGAPMPICARCTGIYAGLLGGVLLFPLLLRLRERVMRKAALAALLPLAIDGLTQLMQFRESTNAIRVATGALAGLAFGLWALSAVEHREEMASVSS
jgi:uncharacterized membrane protein